MSKVIKIKKGLNIRIKGIAEKVLTSAEMPETFAIKPPDFHGIRPKLKVKAGAEVKVGSPLFFDKYNPDVLFTSPVSGTVKAVNRGERRRILEVEVEPEAQQRFEEFRQAKPADLSREEIVENLLKSGLWPFIRQRPYNIIANPDDKPKAIFISGFDSAPLAPDYDFILKDEEEAFQTGLQAISKLTEGKVHLGVNDEFPVSKVYQGAQGLEIHHFKGPHPAGNVGIQIHHISPLAKGETAWYLNPLDLLLIGRLFLTGKLDATRVVALTGSEVKKPRYIRTQVGAKISTILKDNIRQENVRYISGNVLTGTKIKANGYLGFYDSQITVIPEGDYYEFFGWALPGFKKYSVSRTFFSWLTPNKRYRLDTNLHGGERAFIMSGEYEKVFPMNIYPVHLLKAIITEDIEAMENLGIYEVAPEDFALCEFVCTSKIDSQSIVQKGIDLMIKEMS